MSYNEGSALLEMEEQISSKEDVISRMSAEEREYMAVRGLHTTRICCRVRLAHSPCSCSRL